MWLRTRFASPEMLLRVNSFLYSPAKVALRAALLGDLAAGRRRFNELYVNVFARP